MFSNKDTQGRFGTSLSSVVVCCSFRVMVFVLPCTFLNRCLQLGQLRLRPLFKSIELIDNLKRYYEKRGKSSAVTFIDPVTLIVTMSCDVIIVFFTSRYNYVS